MQSDDLFSALFPAWIEPAAAVLLVVAIGGPWAVSLWIVLRRSSVSARWIGALFAIGSAAFLLAIARDPFWASVAALPAVLLAVGRRPFDRLLRWIGEACRSMWRSL